MCSRSCGELIGKRFEHKYSAPYLSTLPVSAKSRLSHGNLYLSAFLRLVYPYGSEVVDECEAQRHTEVSDPG